MMPETKISIIIPNLNSSMIDRTIRSLLEQLQSMDAEIIIVGMDKEGIIRPYLSQVTFIKTERPTPPGLARNIGVKASKGQVILFIDSDCIASNNWLYEHVRFHMETENKYIVGGSVSFPQRPYLTLADNISWFHEFMEHIPAGKKKFLPSINLSLLRSTWDEVGGFNEKPASEDVDLSLRAKEKNISCWFNPKAIVMHYPNRRRIADLVQHAFTFGQCSQKSNPNYQKSLGVPVIMRNWLLVLLFSPILSIGVIFKMIIKEKLPIKYWHTVPAIILTKIVWCFGFAQQLKTREAIENG